MAMSKGKCLLRLRLNSGAAFHPSEKDAECCGGATAAANNRLFSRAHWRKKAPLGAGLSFGYPMMHQFPVGSVRPFYDAQRPPGGLSRTACAMNCRFGVPVPFVDLIMRRHEVGFLT